MSRKIKKVTLVGNTLFTAAGPGGRNDQRVDFTAGPTIRLSIDRELGGVYVEKTAPGAEQAFTVMPGNISHIEWELADKKPKEPEQKPAA